MLFHGVSDSGSQMGLFHKPTFDFVGPPVSLFPVSLISATDFIISYLFFNSYLKVLNWILISLILNHFVL